jgi:hypothetical protein
MNMTSEPKDIGKMLWRRLIVITIILHIVVAVGIYIRLVGDIAIPIFTSSSTSDIHFTTNSLLELNTLFKTKRIRHNAGIGVVVKLSSFSDFIVIPSKEENDEFRIIARCEIEARYFINMRGETFILRIDRKALINCFDDMLKKKLGKNSCSLQDPLQMLPTSFVDEIINK